MGSRPSAKLFFGIYYTYDELPEELVDRMRTEDPPDIIFYLMGIPESVPYEEKLLIRGTFGTQTVNDRKDLILFGFFVAKTSWGLKQLSVPAPEALETMRKQLMGIAERAKLPDHLREPSWYLEADFE